MIKSLASFLSFGLATAGVSTLCAQPLDDDDGPPEFTPEPLEIAIADQFPDAQTDPQTQLIVERANAFLATLDAGQRDAVVFDFTDNAQRPNWSNLPEGLYKRAGIMRGDMTDAQLAALDDLLRAVLSEEGFRNAHLQMAADGELTTGPFVYGPENYYINFLGTPSNSQPWMIQFNGHHLAINATIYGSDVSFSPMFTGGEPLNILYGGEGIYITQHETQAADAFLQSLNADQKAQAIRGAEPIDELLGPGAFGTVIAPEGVRGRDLGAEQQELLLAVVEARTGLANVDDAAVIMDRARAEIEDTYFAWWGPESTLGAAYFRVTAPSLVMEYTPQIIGDSVDYTDHAHNTYRNPRNDYGISWITAE